MSAHLGELVHIFKAVLKNALRDDTDPAGKAQKNSDLGLHIRGKARIGESLGIGRPQPSRGDDAHLIVGFVDLTSDLKELGRERLQMLGNDIFDHDIPLGRRCRKHKGARFDLVGNDRISGSVQILNALDADHIRSGSLDLGAHAVEEVRRIDNVRLLGRILDDGGALRHDGSHHDVDRGADGDDIHIDVGSAQDLRLSDHHSGRCQADIRPQGPEALDMLVDRAQADVAASRQSHGSAPVLAQKRSDQIIGPPDLADIIVVHDSISADHGSLTSGMFSIVTVSLLMTEAASIPSAAFFAPAISTSPLREFPPLTI